MRWRFKQGKRRKRRQTGSVARMRYYLTNSDRRYARRRSTWR